MTLLLLVLLADPLADFRRERAAADAAPAVLAEADARAAEAEAAATNGDAATADRLAREARWLLPARPAGLPPHVRRVVGAGRLRHADQCRVNAVAYLPDGRAVVSAAEDGTVRVWDLGSGQERLAYRGHVGASNRLKAAALAVRPDGALVASAGGPDIHLWDPATGRLARTLAGGHLDAVKAVAFSPDGGTLVAGDDKGRVVVWDAAAGTPRHTLPARGGLRVEGVAVAPSGKQFAVASQTGELVLYDLPDPKAPPAVTSPDDAGKRPLQAVAFSGAGVLVGGDSGDARVYAAGGGPVPAGTAVRTLAGHVGGVLAVAADPAGAVQVTAGRDGTVRTWNGATGKPGRLFHAHPGGATAVAVRPDGQEAVSGGADGRLRVWPLAAADAHRTVNLPAPAFAAAVAPDGKRAAAAGADGVVRLFDPTTGKRLAELTGHTAGVAALAFAGPDRLASGGGDRVVKLWDLAAGTPTDLPGHTSAVLALAAGDGKLFSAGADGTVRAWALPGGKPLWAWAARSAVCGLAALPGGRLACGTADGTLILLDAAGAPKPLGESVAHARGVLGVAARADGSLVATAGGDGAVRLWRPSAGGPLPAGRLDLPPKPGADPPAAAAVGFAADGQLLAVGTADGLVRVWDVAGGGERATLRGHAGWVTAVGFTPDGRTVVAAGADQTVRLFPLPRADGRAAGHAGRVGAVALSPDGGTLATGSDDKTVRLWDAATGAERATLTGPADAVSALAFGPAGTLAVASADGRLRWFDPRGKELRSVPTGRTFVLAVGADGGAVAAWTPANRSDVRLGFDRFPPGDGPASATLERGRAFTCAAAAADAGLGAVGGDDGAVRLWDLRTGKPSGADWKRSDKPLVDVQFTPDGKGLVTLDEVGAVTAADLAGRTVTLTTRLPGATGLAVAAGRVAAFGPDGTVAAFGPDGAELRRWPLPGPVAAAAFAADGKTLAVGNADGTAYLLDLP